jgi:hypothetical protein
MNNIIEIREEIGNKFYQNDFEGTLLLIEQYLKINDVGIYGKLLYVYMPFFKHT